MRLFIAILFDEATLDAIASYRDRLHDVSLEGRFPPRENLHLTLEFLGELDGTAAVERAMRSVRFPSFDIVMDRIGFFQRDGGDTWWLGVEKDNPVGKLQLELHKALAAQGIRTERRRYVPHITLARGVISDAPACRIEPIRCHAGSFDLMLSEREGRGMRYTSLLSVPLGKAY